MNEQMRLLVGLQEIDSSILSIAEKIESLPDRLGKWKAPLKEANASVLKIKTKYEKLNRDKKEKELKLEDIQEKINKLKSRSSGIKTNKEYEAHLKEIKTFERNRFQIEDEILSLMEDIEVLTKDLQKEDVKVKKAEEDFKQQENALEEEKKKLHSEMEMCKTKRKDLVAQIDGETYEQYMNLLKKLGGLAVVPAEKEVCLGCNTNIPPQLYNDIRKNENIFICYYCRRFLYYSESRK